MRIPKTFKNYNPVRDHTVILTIHNKSKSIKDILLALINSLSSFTKEIILVFDGCTDDSYSIVMNLLQNLKNKNRFNFKIIKTNDIWETKANNKGLLDVRTEYVSIVQDDMLIKQKNWDLKFKQVFEKNNIFALSGRAAHDFSFKNGKLYIENIVGREYPFGNRNLFSKLIAKFLTIFRLFNIYKFFSQLNFRTVANRGPLFLKMSYLKELNFFDEEFAPFELDDIDLCCRAYKKFSLLSASLPIFYRTICGSKKNSDYSRNVSIESIEKNTKILIERHSDLVL